MGNFSVKNSSSLRTMYVKEIIFENTDENHFISVNEILKALETNYGITTSRKTIYDDIDMLISAGYDIECVKGKINNSNMYHVLSREFDVAELRIMIDAVKSLKSLSVSRRNALIKKVSRLAGPSADRISENITNDLSDISANSHIYYVIDTLCNAIIMKKQVFFRYCENISSEKKPIKGVGEEFQVSPYKLLCCNDFYYLFGYSEKLLKIAVFRIDWISSVPTVTDTSCIPEPKTLYMESYPGNLPEKKSDKETDIILEFDNSVMDIVIKRFGKEMDITYICNSICRVTVKIQICNEFFSWIFSLEGKVRIKKPRDITEQYIRMVSKEMARL